jgi:hypothetical protein
MPLLEAAAKSVCQVPPPKSAMDRQFDQGLERLNMANFQIMQRSLDQATLAITQLTHTLQMSYFAQERQAREASTPMRASAKPVVTEDETDKKQSE